MHLRWDQIVKLKLKMRRWKSTKLASASKETDEGASLSSSKMKHPKSCHEGLCFIISPDNSTNGQGCSSSAASASEGTDLTADKIGHCSSECVSSSADNTATNAFRYYCLKTGGGGGSGCVNVLSDTAAAVTVGDGDGPELLLLSVTNLLVIFNH